MATQHTQAGPPVETTEQTLTPDQIKQLAEAETELASDLKQLGDESKKKPGMVSADLLAAIEETERRGFVSRMLEADLSRELFAADARLAKVFAVSGVFKDIKGSNPMQAIAAAMTKIRLGRSWGLSEADAMQFVYFTNGRPSVMSEVIACKLQDAGWAWDLRWHQDAQKNCIGCTLYPKRQNKAGDYEYLAEIDPADETGHKMRRVEISFTKQDADRANIWENGQQIPLSQKWNYVSWAADMYFSRCIIRFKRRYASNILKGALTVDEAQEMKPENLPERANISLEHITPSADANRGHDHTEPDAEGKGRRAVPTIDQVRDAQKAVARDKAASQVQAHHLDLMKWVDQVGKEAFWRVLGSSGYGGIEEVPAGEAKKIIDELKVLSMPGVGAGV